MPQLKIASEKRLKHLTIGVKISIFAMVMSGAKLTWKKEIKKNEIEISNANKQKPVVIGATNVRNYEEALSSILNEKAGEKSTEMFEIESGKKILWRKTLLNHGHKNKTKMTNSKQK